MNTPLAFIFAAMNSAKIIVQIFITVLLVWKDSYMMLWAFLGVMVLDSLGLIYFLWTDTDQSNYKARFWVFNTLQLEAIHIIVYDGIPMSLKMNTAYRAFREYLYAALNMVFVFTLQVKEEGTSYNIEINQFIILLLRLFMFAVYLYSFNIMHFQKRLSFGGFFDGISIIFSYNLTLGALSLIYYGEKQYNLGLVALLVILVTNLISMLVNIRQIKDNRNSNLFNTLMCSLTCNSHYKKLCSYGEKKPTIIFRYMNLLGMIVALILFSAKTVLTNLQDFLHLPLNTKLVTSISLIAFVLCILHLLRYQEQFLVYTFSEKSYYIRSDEEMVSVTKDLKSKMYITTQVDILMKKEDNPNDEIEQAVQVEQKQLVDNQCGNSKCFRQYQFMKSISHLLKNRVKVKIHQEDLQICDVHIQELLSTEQFVYLKLLNQVLLQEKYGKKEILIEVIKERFSNGILDSQITERMINKLDDEEKFIIKNMSIQALQVIAFLKHEARHMTMLPDLLLFDLYSIDT